MNANSKKKEAFKQLKRHFTSPLKLTLTQLTIAMKADVGASMYRRVLWDSNFDREAPRWRKKIFFESILKSHVNQDRLIAWYASRNSHYAERLGSKTIFFDGHYYAGEPSFYWVAEKKEQVPRWSFKIGQQQLVFGYDIAGPSGKLHLVHVEDVTEEDLPF